MSDKPKSDKITSQGGVTLDESDLDSVAGGASDIFAKLGDIKGESLDDKHKDEIEVLSFQRK